MPTSGSQDFTVTAEEIITEALEQMGVLGEGEAPTTGQISSSMRTLNMIVKTLQATEVNLFAVQKTYVFFQKDQVTYDLSLTGDHWTTNFISTTIAVAGVATDLTIEVVDATGILTGDNIGIIMDDGTLFWTTVNGAPVGNVITLTDALPSDVSVSQKVYDYVNKVNRPMQLLDYTYTDNSGLDTPLFKLTRNSYIELPTKTNVGKTTNIYFDPQLNSSFISVWPINSDLDAYMTLWVQRTLDDFDATTDNPDFPQEWYLPLTFTLAVLLCPKYGVSRFDRVFLKGMADEYMEMVMSFDTEDEISFEPSSEQSRDI